MSDDADPAAGILQPSTDSTSVNRLAAVEIQSLHEAYSRELLAFLIGVLKDSHAAQDVSQITFGRLLESGHTAREDTIKGWIFKTALREALIYRRQLTARGQHLERYSRLSVATSEPEWIVKELINEEDIGRLQQLINRLSPEQQHVIRQRLYENKTFAEIADELKVPLGTVLTRMRLGLEKVRKWFGGDNSSA